MRQEVLVGCLACNILLQWHVRIHQESWGAPVSAGNTADNGEDKIVKNHANPESIGLSDLASGDRGAP